MPTRPIKQRLVPYKLLGFLLYGPETHIEWLSVLPEGYIKVDTGPCSRDFRIRVHQVWDALEWLKDNGMIEKSKKGPKRGIAIIKLKQPGNLEGYKHA